MLKGASILRSRSISCGQRPTSNSCLTSLPFSSRMQIDERFCEHPIRRIACKPPVGLRRWVLTHSTSLGRPRGLLHSFIFAFYISNYYLYVKLLVGKGLYSRQVL